MRRPFNAPSALHRSIVWVPMVLLACSVVAAAEVPLVVAVDTSRSLSPGDLSSMASVVGEIMDQLPTGTPFGLLAFDDSPRWVVEPPASAAAVSSALGELVPSGNFTLLNDALFTAARDLSGGGVILVLTDGRDENSATTVEDVASLCRANHVRIVSLGFGRRVNERALRRLALLTNGAAVGNAGKADAADVAGTIWTALVALASEVEESSPPVEAEAETPAPTAVPAQPLVVEAGGAPWWLLPLLVLLFLLVLVMLFMLWRWRSALRVGPEASPAGDWETDPMMTPESMGDGGRGPALDLGPAPPMDEQADELVLDPSAFERLPFDGNIDVTSVLDEQHILTLLEDGKETRSFRLRPERAFAVGRAPGVNTLVLESRALSAQHFKIVPHEGGFAIVDLDSTNGTLVNGRKIRARHLEAGDTIRAGDVELRFKVVLKSLA